MNNGDMNQDVLELRAHLFATLRALRDKTDPMDPERARAITAVAKEITDTARVEIDFLRVTNAGPEEGTGFLSPPRERAEPRSNGIDGVTRHLLR